MHWKTRLSVIGFCSLAFLLAPVTLTALGNDSAESASTAAHDSQAAGKQAAVPAATAPAASPQAPESAPNPRSGERVDTPSPDNGETSVQDAAPSRDSVLDAQIRQWIGSLSKEKGFEAWSKASWDVYPLGPGTHSWAVLLRDAGVEIGYMVAAATEDGSYKLMEYGTGQNPLFSMETLYHTMVQRGLIPDHTTYFQFIRKPPLKVTRWYVPPLQAVWRLEDTAGNRYFDAKTGEELPSLDGWLEQQQKDAGSAGTIKTAAAASPSGNVKEALDWEPHDPFLKPVWLKGKPMAPSLFGKWKKTAAAPGAALTYSGKWYGGIALYPLAVSGYHLWSGGQPYVRLEHNGSRFAAYEDTLSLGGYYPAP